MSVKSVLMNTSVNKRQTLIKEFVAEFVGTFTLLTIGNSVIAANILQGKNADSFHVCFAYGVGAMIAILACGHLSGAHINPAGTFAQAILNKFPWHKVWYYLTAQYLAGFVSSIIIYLVYYDAFNIYDVKYAGIYDNATLIHNKASVFTTFPFDGVTLRGVLIDQIIGTAMLFFSISAIGNSKGFSLPSSFQAPITGLLITGCCLAFGLNAGAIFNPARDLTPRIFAWLVFGCSKEVFNPIGGNYWWAAAVIGPHIGAVLGVFIFKVSCDHYSEEQENQKKQKKPKELFGIEDSTKKVNESTMSIC